MERRDFSDVPYQPFKFRTQLPRMSAQSELDTLGELLPNLPSESLRYQTDDPRKNMFQQDSQAEPPAIVVETLQEHHDSDPDIDEVLEPPSSRTLKEAWIERPIRQLSLAAQQTPSDQRSSDYIRILRQGGDFEVTYEGRRLGVKHVFTNEDLTLLIWYAPRNQKKRKEMNVFELLHAKLDGETIVLGTMMGDSRELRLRVAESNTVDRLMPGSDLNDNAKKAGAWYEAFQRLVTMKLQPKVYRS